MHLGELTRPELVFLELPGADRPTVLKAMADRLVSATALDDADLLYERLREREQLGSTGVGSGVAIPHCKMKHLDEVLIAIGTSHRGVDFGGEDQQPVRLLFLIVSPEGNPAAHLRSLSAISKWVKNRANVDEILEMDDPQAIYQLLRREEV